MIEPAPASVMAALNAGKYVSRKSRALTMESKLCRPASGPL
jgi:hypothetical protein